jgi:hypothetical protein
MFENPTVNRHALCNSCRKIVCCSSVSICAFLYARSRIQTASEQFVSWTDLPLWTQFFIQPLRQKSNGVTSGDPHISISVTIFRISCILVWALFRTMTATISSQNIRVSYWIILYSLRPLYLRNTARYLSLVVYWLSGQTKRQLRLSECCHLVMLRYVTCPTRICNWSVPSYLAENTPSTCSSVYGSPGQMTLATWQQEREPLTQSHQAHYRPPVQGRSNVYRGESSANDRNAWRPISSSYEVSRNDR